MHQIRGGIKVMSPVIENPHYDFVELAQLFRISAIKNTTLSIHANDNLMGELYLLKGESQIITKSSSETVTCPDSFCSKIKFVD